MTLAILIISHVAAALGIFRIMHARGCNRSERAFWVLAGIGTALRPMSSLFPRMAVVEGIAVLIFAAVLWLRSGTVQRARYAASDVSDAASGSHEVSRELREAIQQVTRGWVWHSLTRRGSSIGIIEVDRDGIIRRAAGGGASSQWEGAALWSDVTRRAHALALEGKSTDYDDVDDGWRYMVTVSPRYDEVGEVVGSLIDYKRRQDGPRE